jgi:transcriptional regulator with PAS, ATPase and Fis domain
MKKKPLAHYLDRLDSLDKYDWIKAKQYGETALKKLPTLSYSPHEEYMLYLWLGNTYFHLVEYSRSLNIFYKASLIAVKQGFSAADTTYPLFGIGHSLAAMKNINQALVQFHKIEQYYQKYGDNIFPMDKQIYIDTLIGLGNCYLYKNKLEQVKEIIEQKLLPCQPFPTNGFTPINYNRFKGKYLMAAKKYDEARQSFHKCFKLSEQLGFSYATSEIKIHLATIDLLENRLALAIQGFEDIMKNARRLKFNSIFCEAGLFLSKCYLLNNMPAKSASVDKMIKPFLTALDITWLYEKTRELEQLYRQLQPTRLTERQVGQVYQTETESIPTILTHAVTQHYEKSGYKHLIIGKSLSMIEVYQLIEKIAPTDLPVLIQGETGTGKELVARAIHYNSPARRDKPFITQNCAAFAESLLESELFGHIRGAFTDAVTDKRGLFEIANHGTLFLDEIGEMSLGMQSKLLRVVEQGEIRRVGDEKVIPVDVRIISATNKDIKLLTQQGGFREDLYYRLQGINITLPPLREKKEDIPLLISHFLRNICRNTDKKIEFNKEALQLLLDYDWPGNVRELETEVERAVTLSKSQEIITPEVLSSYIRIPIKRGNVVNLNDSLQGKTLPELQEQIEKKLITNALKETKWNISATAKLMGIPRSTLQDKLQKYGLEGTIK